MPGKSKKKLSLGWVALIIVLALFDFAVLIKILLQGKNVALFNPKGLIAQEQFNLLIFTIALMLVVAVPSVLLLYFIAWKYRETNDKTAYEPNARHGRLFNVTVWGIPTLFMLLLAAAMLPATQRLEPQKLIASDIEPLKIQVVSLRWKWLFIYPEQNIATVNHVQIPVNRPVQFELTADEAPMSSFWIPNLAGQLYTMTGHVNRLNLVADTTGAYPGSSAEINGAGFAGMKFTTYVSDGHTFDNWVQEVKQSPDTLNALTYETLLKPSENNPAAFYSAYESGIYDKVVLKYTGHHEESEDKTYEHYTGH